MISSQKTNMIFVKKSGMAIVEVAEDAAELASDIVCVASITPSSYLMIVVSIYK